MLIFVYTIIELPYKSRFTVDSFEYREARIIPAVSTSRSSDFNKPPSAPCETVHLAFTAEDVSLTVNLVKSILIHRHSSLHFHIVSQPFTAGILKNILSTWTLPYFNFTFYSLQSLKDGVSWIPGTKLANIQGLTKLLLPNVISRDIPRLIVIDSNVTFIGDIGELDQFIWKMQDDHIVFASVGKHFNSVVSP